MGNKKGIVVIVILCLLVAVLAGVATYKYLDSKDSDVSDKPKEPKEPENPSTPPTKFNDKEYNVKLIKTVNSTQEGNYLISPYSIEIALNMLRDGANGDTKKQIDDVIGTRNINVFTSKDRISVTNGAFIKDEYKDVILQSYYDKLSNYKAELVFDKFNTPDKINNWVKEHTYGMIDKILDSMSPDFVMGIANAVAIDVEWSNSFECNRTTSSEFTKTDGTMMNVEMMHNSYEYGNTVLFETEDATGVVIPYQSYDKDGNSKYDSEDKNEENFTQLEFVGILPNKDVNEYINSLTQDKLDKLEEKSYKAGAYNINVALPRFSYSFNLDNFMDVLEAMGIKDVFNPEKADLSNIMTKEPIYVSTAIHKTYIDLNEKGTKAAAVTYFGMEKSAIAPEKVERKRIEFNKPFVYMIRDSKTKEMLFFGVVENPNEWKGSTCSNIEE